LSNACGMKFWKKEKGVPERIRATREQAQQLAADAEKAARNATKRFRRSIIFFVAGLLPIGALGLYSARNALEGNIENTLYFIMASIGVCSIIVFYLSRDLERKFDGLTGTIQDKGLSRRVRK